MALEARLRSPKEEALFAIGVVISALSWLAVVISIVGILYGGAILVFFLIAHALFLAHVKGNGVRVSERQLPELYARCKAAAQKLGLAQVPEVYLLQSHGILNAFATKLLSRKFIVIYSELADHCQDPRQLDFVIGHELGHFAAGHLAWNAFLAPYYLVPWLGAAYSRACEYTCDRCGFAVVGDLEQSIRGLVVLAAGGKHAASVDLNAFMDQRAETGSFWMAILELVSSHPYLCKRAGALQEMANPGTVKAVGRNIFAYPLAPVLGITAGGGGAMGGMMVMVAIMGILAAIAIPSFIKFQERAKQAAALHQGAGTAAAGQNPDLLPEDDGAPSGDAPGGLEGEETEARQEQ